MKNILIPTTFEADTLQALKLAAYIAENSGNIFLLSNSAISDSVTELLFLSVDDEVDVGKRERVLNHWTQYKLTNQIRMTVHTHHQFGMSRPLLNQLLERFEADIIITPQSFQKSKNYTHKLLLKLLHRSECPMMLLPEKEQVHESIQRALYLDDDGKVLSESLQHMPFHVIHQSMIHATEGQTLHKLIDQLNVDLIVKAKRNIEEVETHNEVVDLGLPVLTV